MSGWRALTTAMSCAALTAVTGAAAVMPSAAADAQQSSGWHSSVLAKISKNTVAAAYSRGRNSAYVLVAAKPGGYGPYRLEKIGLASHRTLRGPRFPARSLTLAGHYLWISGQSAAPGYRAVLYQVNPATLAVVRSWTLQRKVSSYTAVTTGPRGTVWVGYSRTLRQLSTRTGATLRERHLRAAWEFVDVATDPAVRFLYASVTTFGKAGGNAVREYSARTGRQLASNAGKPLTFSLGGADLTAVPGGVWASFRTGMAGQTVLLRQRGLKVVHVTGGRRLFGWFQSASTTYGGGSLWITNEADPHGSRFGCVAPSTGAVRSAAVLRALSGDDELLGVRPAAREVISLDDSGILAVTAPARCWR